MLLVDWCGILYEHKNYEGWNKYVADDDKFDLHDEQNDQFSSVKIKKGCTIELFAHNNLLLLTLTQNKSSLPHLDDHISSVSCQCSGKCKSHKKETHNSFKRAP